VTEYEGKTLTVDLDAVRSIISDIRNGEHYSWDDGWAESSAEVLDSLLRQVVPASLLERALSAAESPFVDSIVAGELRALIQNGADR
jgi:hypothetical protein